MLPKHASDRGPRGTLGTSWECTLRQEACLKHLPFKTLGWEARHVAKPMHLSPRDANGDAVHAESLAEVL